MISWIKRLFTKPSVPALYFKDAQAAFEYASIYLDNSISEGKVIPCLVDDVIFTTNSGWIAHIRLPSILGGIEKIAALPNNDNYKNLKGKLCAAYVGPTASIGNNENAIIVFAELKPELSNSGWKISKKFLG